MYKSSARMGKFLCIASCSGLIYLFLGNVSKFILENYFVFFVFFLFFFSMLMYMDSVSLEITDEELIYKTALGVEVMRLSDIKSVELTYFNKNVRSLFPVLNVIGKGKRIDIPSRMFEKDLEEIMIRLSKYMR